MKPRRSVLLALSMLTLLLPCALAGGSGPPAATPGRSVDLAGDSGAATVTVHPGELLRLRMSQSPFEDGRTWSALNQAPGLRLLVRDDVPQGDHGYAMLTSDITYSYRVLDSAPATRFLLFALADSQHPQTQHPHTATRWLVAVKVVR